MAKFCSKCGTRLKAGAKFCSSCGNTPINNETKASENIIGYWDAKEHDNSDDYSKRIKGSLALSKDEIVFFRYAAISGNPKKWRTIPLNGIKSITRIPIFSLIMIKYNRKPGKTGFFSKVFNGRNISYKISNWQSFIENIKRLNPNIKIKT